MLKIRTSFAHPFHRALATPEWLARLEQAALERLRASGAFRSEEGEGTLTAEFEEDRYMGPNSVVKYRFRLNLDIRRPGMEGRADHFGAQITWDPDSSSFSWDHESRSTVEGQRAEELAEEWDNRLQRPNALREVLESARKTDCPICSKRFRIQIYPEGKMGLVSCPGHFTFHWYFKSRKDLPAWWEEHVADRTCPTCASSDAVVGILYGLIRDTSGIDPKVWVLGGCVVQKERWHCRSCNFSF